VTTATTCLKHVNILSVLAFLLPSMSVAFAGPPKYTPWAVLRCYPTDARQPLAIPTNYAANPEKYFQDFFTSSGKGKGGIFDYWEQISNGQMSLQGTEVFPWVSLGIPYSFAVQLAFAQAAQPCFDKTRELLGFKGIGADYFAKFYGIFVIVNVKGGEQGSSSVALTANGATWRTLPLVVFSLDVLNPSNAAHEMGHGYGLAHSYDTFGHSCGGPASDPGVYCGYWDVMGAPFNGGTLFVNPTFNGSCGPSCLGQNMGGSGPGLNAQHMSYLGWISDAQTYVYDQSKPNTVTVKLAALEFPQLGFPLQIGVPTSHSIAARYRNVSIPNGYTIEYHRSAGWDRGFADAVIIYAGWSPGGAAQTYVIDDRGGPLWHAGQSLVDPYNNLVIVIKSFDDEQNTATITLSRLGLGSAGGNAGVGSGEDGSSSYEGFNPDATFPPPVHLLVPDQPPKK
jgi:hypothetical protein